MIVLLIMLIILVLIGFFGSIALCRANIPTPEEQVKEDEEQIKYLREWRIKKEMCAGAKKSGACPKNCEFCAWNNKKDGEQDEI